MSTFLWEFQSLNIDISPSTDKWQRYTIKDQLDIERSYRSDDQQVELGTCIIHFSYGQHLDDDGGVYRVKRNRLKNKLSLRHQFGESSNLDTSKISIEDWFTEVCLDHSIKIDRETIIKGIQIEGKRRNLEKQTSSLVEELESVDADNDVLVGLRCLHLYTRASFLSRTVNRFLRTGDLDKISTLGPFCKMLYKQFDKYPTVIDSLKVYRGAHLRLSTVLRYKRAIKKGLRQWSGFTSATKSINVARIFRGNCLFVIRLKEVHGYGRILDISKLSQFDEEEEVLFRPGVEYTVQRYKYKRSTKIYTFYLTVYI